MGNDFEVMCLGNGSTAANVIDIPVRNILGSLLTIGLVYLQVIEIWNVSDRCQIRSIN